MTLSTDLDAYQALRQSHRSQTELRLAELHETIAQQLQAFESEEQRLLEAQRDAIAQLQSRIASDIRCLLSEPTFHAQIIHWLSTRSRLSGDEPDLSSDLSIWTLRHLPFPVQLVENRLLVDDCAYNDENHYTEYRYELVVQIGSWTKTIGAAIAQLSPGTPMNYSNIDFGQQQYELAYQLKPIQRWNEPPESQFAELNLMVERNYSA